MDQIIALFKKAAPLAVLVIGIFIAATNADSESMILVGSAFAVLGAKELF